MYTWSCDRRRFVDFLTNRAPLSESAVGTADAPDGIAPRGEELVLVWQKPPTEAFALPRAVIVAEESVSDFLAWVLTYFRQIRPFTAHCRILTAKFIHLCDQIARSGPGLDLRSADVGLIIAEGIAYSVGRTDINRLPFTAFARTLSFAFADGAKRYGLAFTENLVEQVSSGWASARELSHQAPLELPPTAINDVWAVILSVGADSSRILKKDAPEGLLVEAVRGVKADGVVPKETWKKLAARVLRDISAAEALDGPREARVRAVESAIRELAHRREGARWERAFVAGYMASRIQPGSLDHFAVLFPAIAELRECLLWYGACAGLTPETSVDNYGNGLGWLMKREVRRPAHWLDRPNCDIAISEMAVLLGDRKGAKPSIPTLSSGVLKVEIVPLISTIVKWPEQVEDNFGDKRMAASNPKTFFDEDTQLREEILEILRRIEDSAMLLDSIRRQVETVFGGKSSKNRNRRK
jgi:hypothetical protein